MYWMPKLGGCIRPKELVLNQLKVSQQLSGQTGAYIVV